MKPVYTDTVEEYRHLRSGCGLIDYAEAGLFRVSGPAAAGFLSEVSTRNVDFLLEGQVLAALLLAEDGTVIAEVLVHGRGDDYLVEVWPRQRDAAGARLSQAAAAAEGATVGDVSEDFAVYGIEGPTSFRAAQEFLPFPIASMAYRSYVTATWQDAPLLVSRTGVTGEYGFKLHVPAGHGDAVRARLLDLDARECGLDAIDACRMEMRFVNVEREGGPDRATPYQLGLLWMVDFGHAFHGREALQRRWSAGPERLPVCWRADGDLDGPPAAGTSLGAGGTEVGQVRHAVWSPGLDRVIGTALVDREVAASGLVLELAPSGPVTTVSAPFRVATSFQVPLE
jgi:aminomethyltransferase